MRPEPAPEPGEHLGPHFRRVGVADIGIEDAPEAIARPQRLIGASDGTLEGKNPVGRRASIKFPGQRQKRPGRDQCQYPLAVEVLEKAVDKVIDAMLA